MSATVSSTTSPAPSRSIRHGRDLPAGTGPYAFRAGEEVVIAGWAFLDPPDAAPPAVALAVVSADTGSVTHLAVQRTARPDVARHFALDDVMKWGFESRFRIDPAWHGTYRVRMSLVEDAGAQPTVDLFSFTVAPSSYELVVRRELAARFLEGAGLEIGALQRRLEVPAHCAVTYVDRMPLADLLAHYPELVGQPIQAPDLIDDGETLGKVRSDSQDFVVANHFLEHCENPIQTMLNLTRVLKDGGILFMAVPDKRFTFDVERPTTAYETLANAYTSGHRRDTVRQFVEWAAHVSHVAPGEVPAVARRLQAEKYSIHFNVWALSDLIEFLARSRREFNLPFTLEWLVCSENEVIVILRKQSAASAAGT